MKVFITGGLGFVGSSLSKRLAVEGHEVTVVDIAPRPPDNFNDRTRYVSADTTVPGPWQKAAAEADLIINLAGASIFRRWNDDYKKLLRDSRILTTKNLVDAIEPDSTTALISTSAVGYYGFRQDEELDESGRPGDDFLAQLCVDWEAAALEARKKGSRVVLTRFGLVLGPGGGALGQMLPVFKSFIGGPIGSGGQWFSWIYVNDLLRAFEFVIHDSSIKGPVNFCAPVPVTNRDMARALGKVLKRPSFIKTPAFALKAVFGEFGSVLTEGQRVVPKKLMDRGFSFDYARIEEALRQVAAK